MSDLATLPLLSLHAVLLTPRSDASAAFMYPGPALASLQPSPSPVDPPDLAALLAVYDEFSVPTRNRSTASLRVNEEVRLHGTSLLIGEHTHEPESQLESGDGLVHGTVKLPMHTHLSPLGMG